jgi:hypothetical protein
LVSIIIRDFQFETLGGLLTCALIVIVYCHRQRCRKIVIFRLHRGIPFILLLVGHRMLSGTCLACKCLPGRTKVVLKSYGFKVLQLRFYSELVYGGLWHPTLGKCPLVLRLLRTNNCFRRLLIQRVPSRHQFLQILG